MNEQYGSDKGNFDNDASNSAASATVQGAAVEKHPPEQLPPLSLSPYRHKRGLFILAVVLQVMLLAGLATAPAHTLMTGKAVTFETSPVDPWDMFRGDYVNLGYDFGQIKDNDDLDGGDRVFVVIFRNEDGKWKPRGVFQNKPNIDDKNEVLLQATVRRRHEGITYVDYGIERVYIAESRGRNLKSGDRLEVDAVIDWRGRAIVKELRGRDGSLYKWRLI